MKPTELIAALAGAALCCAATQVAASPFAHVTDGVFTSGAEWTGTNVSKTFFPAVGPDGPAQSGGAYLYVEQGNRQFNQLKTINPELVAFGTPNTLFLMYDWVNSVKFAVDAHSFLDVFFQVNGSVHAADYLVRMFAGTDNFQAYERAPGSPAPVNPDGSFNVGAGSGWSALDAEDLALAKFRTAIGSGASPDDATPHLMAEFELSIDNSSPDRGGSQSAPGLYDPAPAFWSASAKIGIDPPLSSGMFSLNPDGSTNVTSVFGPNGGPISQPIQPLAVPEPSTLLLAGLGLLACLGINKGRKTSDERVRGA